jgi:hypothetical protein
MRRGQSCAPPRRVDVQPYRHTSATWPAQVPRDSSRAVAVTTRPCANVAADMREHFVIDPLISKRQQLLLATQLCRMVLKVRLLPRLIRVLIRLDHAPPCVIVVRPPLVPSFPCALARRSGKRGSEALRYTRRQIRAHHAPCFRERLSPRALHYRFLSLIPPNTSQVNNVIIAGNDEQDY